VITIRRFLALIVVLLFAAMGISLQLKAAIGVAPFDALNQTISYAFEIKVGDVVTILQFLFVFLQILFLKRDTSWKIFLQIFAGALLGQFVNFFFYIIFADLVVTHYVLRLGLLIAGCLWVPIFIGAVMVLDFVTMPIESLSLVISNEMTFSFGQVRQFVDIICVVLALVLTVIYSVPFTIREGTILSALTFGPLLSFYMPKIEKLFKRWKLVNDSI
jgi:uncharacterized membrane protein YczE